METVIQIVFAALLVLGVPFIMVKVKEYKPSYLILFPIVFGIISFTLFFIGIVFDQDGWGGLIYALFGFIALIMMVFTLIIAFILKARK